MVKGDHYWSHSRLWLCPLHLFSTSCFWMNCKANIKTNQWLKPSLFIIKINKMQWNTVMFGTIVWLYTNVLFSLLHNWTFFLVKVKLTFKIDRASPVTTVRCSVNCFPATEMKSNSRLSVIERIVLQSCLSRVILSFYHSSLTLAHRCQRAACSWK